MAAVVVLERRFSRAACGTTRPLHRPRSISSTSSLLDQSAAEPSISSRTRTPARARSASASANSTAMSPRQYTNVIMSTVCSARPDGLEHRREDLVAVAQDGERVALGEGRADDDLEPTTKRLCSKSATSIPVGCSSLSDRGLTPGRGVRLHARLEARRRAELGPSGRPPGGGPYAARRPSWRAIALVLGPEMSPRGSVAGRPCPRRHPRRRAARPVPALLEEASPGSPGPGPGPGSGRTPGWSSSEPTPSPPRCRRPPGSAAAATDRRTCSPAAAQ